MRTTDAPDWYADWSDEALHGLQDKIARMQAEFRLGQWPRFDIDLTTRTLIFSENGVPKVRAEIQIVGTTSNADWLWGWANTSLPPGSIAESAQVRDFGQQHGICDLTHERARGEDLNALGWKMTAIMARVTGAMGAYRPPRSDVGAIFLTYKNMAWAT